MPNSRKRRPRNQSARDRKQRRRRTSQAARRESDRGSFTLGGPSPYSSLENFLTDEDHQNLQACVDAEAQGDAELALHHCLSGAIVEGSLHHCQLRQLVLLGDEAPAWVISRWICSQAYRWLLLGADPRTDLAVLSTLGIAFPEADREAPFGLELREFGTRIAATDWICEQLAVYEFDGLVDFLDTCATPGLLARADDMRAWGSARMGGYLIEGFDAGRLLLRDLATEEAVAVLDIGAATGRRLGASVLGRIVPISVAPGLMFESRPVLVDEVTAREAAVRVRDGDRFGWAEAIEEACLADRLPACFSWGNATLLTSDILSEPPWEAHEEDGSDAEGPGRMSDLLAAGVSEYAATGVLICEFGLKVARISEEMVAIVAPYLASDLLEPSVLAAAREHCVAAENERGWRALAAALPEPMRSRCLEVAELCRQRRAQAS